MPTKAEKLLSKGKALESKGKRDRALDLYRDACRAEPYDPDVWMARGEAARAMAWPARPPSPCSTSASCSPAAVSPPTRCAW
jgi:hypothetical protein